MKKPKKLARVVIDDDLLVEEAVRLGGHRTKRETVERALEEFIKYHRQQLTVEPRKRKD